MARFYGPFFVAGAAARVPFGLADADGLLPKDLAPAELSITVTGPDGDALAEDLVVAVQTDGVPRPFYAFEVEPDAVGFHDVAIDTGSGVLQSQFQVVESDSPLVEARVDPGDPMPATPTPTTSDPRGVTPICTRDPACDLHEISLDEAVGAGPVALLISTPGFCQTVVCGPILDLFLAQRADFPDVTFLHAEVYSDPESNSVPPEPEDSAPIVRALGLPYEPVLYTVGADGVVAGRLDYVFDASDIRRSLDHLVG